MGVFVFMSVCACACVRADNAMCPEYTDVDQKIQQYQAVGKHIPMAYRDVK